MGNKTIVGRRRTASLKTLMRKIQMVREKSYLKYLQFHVDCCYCCEHCCWNLCFRHPLDLQVQTMFLLVFLVLFCSTFPILVFSIRFMFSPDSLFFILFIYIHYITSSNNRLCASTTPYFLT